MRASLILTLALVTWIGRARADTIGVIALPSRTVTPALGRIPEQVARRLGMSVAAAESPLALSTSLRDARTLARTGKLDEAAAELDAVLDAAARSPGRIDDPPQLVAGQVRRAAIALARGEMALARTLLARLVRYDPQFVLTDEEESPQLSAVLEDVRRQLGPATIEGADLGDACNRHDVVLVARNGGDGRSEIARFDHCRLVAKAIHTPGDEDDIAARLASAPRADTAEAPSAPRPGRTNVVVGALVAGAGVVASGAGAYFAIRARPGGVTAGCSAAMPCTDAEIGQRLDRRDADRLVASVLLPLGVAAVVTGGVLYVLGRRAESRSRIVIAPGGAVVAWQWAF